jgi:hypothetical protein
LIASSKENYLSSYSYSLRLIIDLISMLSVILINPILASFFVSFSESYGNRKIIYYVSTFFLILSISLSFYNREYGVSWQGGLGIDDAIAYINKYREISDYGFAHILDMNITANIEFFWYFLAYFFSIIFFGNEELFKFASVFIPLLLFFLAFRIANKRHPVLFFSILFNTSNHFLHLIFHVWRASYASSFIALAVSLSLNKIKKSNIFYLISFFTHLSAIFCLFMLILNNYFKKKFDIYLSSTFILISLFFIFLLSKNFGNLLITDSDRQVYFSDMGIYPFQNIFYLYVFSSFLFTFFWPKNAGLYIMMAISMLLVSTFFISSAEGIVSRVIELSIPIYFIGYAYLGTQIKFIYNQFFLVLISCYKFLLIGKLDFVTQYMTYGQFLKVNSGLLLNFICL